MILRSIAILSIVIAASVAATLYFGQDVLIALGLILAQTKLIAKKIPAIELPAILAWLKAQAEIFFRIELLKRWMTTSVVPLILGNAVLRQISAFVARYQRALRARYDAMLAWYAGLGRFEQILAALIILFTTLALSVTSIGLWLILFSVKLPIWIAALAATTGRMVWASLQKMLFRAIAFLQLNWLWRWLRKVLPKSWLERKRRLDYRIARSVIRRRRMTLKQLEAKRHTLPFRLGILVEFFTTKPRG
ncbi:MAG: hypothetical protein HRU32_14870 [Rhodobacteraceae bacterium]|nr:hypothetical protein [Paracoccaceae bacterium]